MEDNCNKGQEHITGNMVNCSRYRSQNTGNIETQTHIESRRTVEARIQNTKALDNSWRKVNSTIRISKLSKGWDPKGC